MSTPQPTRLHTLLGDYPVTRALKSGEVRSPSVTLEYADVRAPASAFKRVVRDLEFDVAELALMTFLLARAHGKPLVLVPAVVFSRFQHPFIVYNASKGTLAPRDLAGRRVAIRSYSVTTVTWLRDILSSDFGVDLGRVRWVTYEEPHVAEFRDPPNVERAPKGAEPMAMLLAGEVDAAIVSAIPTDPRLKPLIPDPEAAARDWQRRHGAMQINHMVVLRQSLTKSHPEAAREVCRMLRDSWRAAGGDAGTAQGSTPFGLEAMRRSLAVAIECAHRQQLIPRRFTVDELFDEVTTSVA